MIEKALELLAIDLAYSENLSTFCDLFEKWNRSINLSAASSRADLEGHVVDSLQVVPYLRGRASVLDVGSGGGLPAIVAAICLPGVRITSLEPVHKKHAFLRTAARELGLATFEPLAERLEAHLKHDYEAAMSRATFDLREWLTMGASYVSPGGLVLGFEAVPRADLPPAVERHPYRLGDRQRAIVAFHVERSPCHAR